MGFWNIFLRYIFILNVLENTWAVSSVPSSVPFVGDNRSILNIVYFFDYKCRFCREMDKIINKFHLANPEAKITYRPLPLLGIESKVLAQVAMAAQQQGKFQQMHAWLIEEGHRASEEKIKDQAIALGMNPAHFQIDLKSQRIEEIVDETLSIALKKNIHTVPGIMINNKVFQEIMTYNEFIRAIQHSVFSES